MSQQMIVASAAPAHLVAYQQQNTAVANNFASGITVGYSSISIRGKVWRIRSGSEENALLDANGSPLPSIMVAFIDANPHLSKTFYAAAFQEGKDISPDCSSANGIAPDAGVLAKQADFCATCPKNVWGSSKTEAGKDAKACSDSRRTSVYAVNQNGIDTTTPYLLNIPAASLKKILEYVNKLDAVGRPMQGVVTRLSFDFAFAYPSIDFTFIRDLSAEEFASVTEATQDIVVKTMIGTNEAAPAVAAPAPVEQAPVQQAAPVQEQPVQQPAPANSFTAPVQEQPAAAQVNGFGAVQVQAESVQQQPAQQAAPANGFGAAQGQPRPLAQVQAEAAIQPAAQVQQTAPAAEQAQPVGSVDALGVPYNPNVHSSGQTFYQSGKMLGQWKLKRGVTVESPEYINHVNQYGQRNHPAMVAPQEQPVAQPTGFGAAPQTGGFGAPAEPQAASIPNSMPEVSGGLADELDDALAALEI